MEKALTGLKYLREMEIAMNDSFRNLEDRKGATRKIVYSVSDFWAVGVDDIYDELLLSYEYGVLGEYKKLLEMVIHRLPGEFKIRHVKNLKDYFYKEYDKHYEDSLLDVRYLNVLLENYEKEKDSIKYTTTEEMMEGEMLGNGDYDRKEDRENNFSQTYLEKIRTLNYYGDKFMDLDNRLRMLDHYPLSDMFEKARELLRLVELKLNDISEPEDVFIDETVVWIVYRVFNELDLIEEIDKETFKDQLRYRNRTLTIKAKRKKKTILAKAISQLSNFVLPEYKGEWEKKMANHFKIKSYSKIKNKQYHSDEEFELERIIRPFKDLFAL